MYFHEYMSVLIQVIVLLFSWPMSSATIFSRDLLNYIFFVFILTEQLMYDRI